MSLRARLLAGCLVIAVLLAGAAVFITRRTEAHLVDRVEGQLAPQVDLIANCGEAGLLAPENAAPPVGQTGERVTVDARDCTQTHIVQESGDPSADPPALDDEADRGRWGSIRNEGSAPTDALVMFSITRIAEGGEEPLEEPLVDNGLPQPEIDLDQARAAAASGEPFTMDSVGSETRWRARAVVDEETGALIVVALSLDDVDAIVEGLVLVEIGLTVAILAALGLVAWWVDRHGIRPIKRMTTTASAIAGGDLSHRVPESHEGTEAGRLGTALNQMLGRIEEAFDERSRSEARLRQFVSDASHELRTPVTTIRGYSDLYETGALEDRAELAEAMRRTRQETLRMGSLVDDLLLLARLDEGPELARAEVDLAALVDDAGRDAKAVDPARDVATTADEPLVVLGDSDRLRQVLANLVGNALVHTPSTAGLELRARRDHGRAVVEIADHGPGMPPEIAHRAFERFYRADPSRSRHRGGSGLGLAIVQATVAVHGGEVWLESLPGEGTTACIALPLPETETPAAL